MGTYVLSHGGWGGGWEWKTVADRLQEAGHDVYRPSLTGLGDRVHLATPEVGLSTHVQDIVSLFDAERLQEVTLCGHSYSGMVITGAAAKLGDRIHHLVYMDGFVPEAGESIFDVSPEPMVEVMLEIMETEGDGWKIPLPFPIPEDAPPELVEYLTRASTPMPVKCFTDSLAEVPVDFSFPVTYIRCTQVEEGDALGAFAERARLRGWPVIPVDSPHDVQFHAPEELARILLDLDAEVSPRE